MSRKQKKFQRSQEEQALLRKKNAAQRRRFLLVTCVLAIGARFLIKDPPPQKTPDRSQKSVRYVPGMLEDLSPSAMAKMDPKILAQMKIAQAKYKQEMQAAASAKGKIIYRPTDAPLANLADEEEVRQTQFIYEKKKQLQIRAAKKMNPIDLTKDMLVRFQSGGAIKAEKTKPLTRDLQIQVDRTILATLPNKMVSTVQSNAAKWKEPIPAGFVQIQPANGITITVSRETAKRISIQKTFSDEI